MTLPKEFEDTVLAAADLVGRSGARQFEMGYLDDDPKNPRWWAQVEYRGSKIFVENFLTPAGAAEALAKRLLRGARCRCGGLVALSPFGAVAFDGTGADGSRMTVEEAKTLKQCLWKRTGRRWDPSCPVPPGR